MRLSTLDPVWTNDNVMTLLQLVLYDEGRVFWFWLRCSTIDMRYSAKGIAGHGVLLI